MVRRVSPRLLFLDLCRIPAFLQTKYRPAETPHGCTDGMALGNGESCDIQCADGFEDGTGSSNYTCAADGNSLSFANLVCIGPWGAIFGGHTCSCHPALKSTYHTVRYRSISCHFWHARQSDRQILGEAPHHAVCGRAAFAFTRVGMCCVALLRAVSKVMDAWTSPAGNRTSHTQ